LKWDIFQCHAETEGLLCWVETYCQQGHFWPQEMVNKAISRGKKWLQDGLQYLD